MAITSWTMNQALATERRRDLAAEAARQRRVAEAEQATGAATKRVRMRDAALVALVLIFTLLAFGLGAGDAEARRVRGSIADPAETGMVEPGTSIDWLSLP